MKKLTLAITFMIVTSLGQLSAQSTYYISKDFGKKGRVEYLNTSYHTYVGYWSNEQPKEVQINLGEGKGAFINNKTYTRTYKAKFQGSNQPVQLVVTLSQQGKKGKIICKHANGTTQVFNELPAVYISSNWEKKNVDEFLVYEPGSDIYYYTSLNPQNKIKLQKVGTVEDKVLVRFPGQKTIYKLWQIPKCNGGVSCISPDGREQHFGVYNWKRKK
jgi:hypothetical protein